MKLAEFLKTIPKNSLIRRDPGAMLLCDFYKVGHLFQYPKGTKRVYANWTPRKSRIDGVNFMVQFGLQRFIVRMLMDFFKENFFDRPEAEIMAEYERVMKYTLGGLPSYDHIRALHQLGYLPIEIKALPEGTLVPMRVPCITVVNTKDEFYWLTNWVETLMSCEIWKMCTNATIAMLYRVILDHYAELTGVPADFVQWQGHDFSFRGMDGWDSAQRSGMSHLLSFTGTDTIPSICGIEYYYGANIEEELVGGSVAATEHSVMCAGGKVTELGTFRRLLTEVYPKGILSVVSDTWNLWDVVTKYVVELKEVILAREGKLVIRPDSGDPVRIIGGYVYKPVDRVEDLVNEDYVNYEYLVVAGRVLKPELVTNTDPGVTAYRLQETKLSLPEVKGVVECLWDVFGGSETEKGYRMLDPHIGVIYGDSITLERAKAICELLMRKRFASQVVLGIGSYTYQMNTRDTFGLAMKATYVEIEGEVDGVVKREGFAIYKDPKTDDGMKKSNCGLLKVYCLDDGNLAVEDQVPWTEEEKSRLTRVFIDGEMTRAEEFKDIKSTLVEGMKRVKNQLL